MEQTMLYGVGRRAQGAEYRFLLQSEDKAPLNARRALNGAAFELSNGAAFCKKKPSAVRITMNGIITN